MTHVEFRAALTESVAERLRERLSALPFKIDYHEEQRGPNLVALIKCTPSQEKTVGQILHDLKVSELSDR